MSRYCCVFLFFLGFCMPLKAQTNREANLQAYQLLDSICSNSDNRQMSTILDNSKKMLELAQSLAVDTLILNAGNFQGQALEWMGVFDAALKLYYENLALAEKIKHCHYEERYLNLIGRVYQTMGDFEKSQAFMVRAKASAIDCRQFLDTISINFEIGYNDASMGDFDAGLQRIELNVEAAKRANKLDDILYGLDNLANLYAENGEPEKALGYAQELLNIPEAWEADFEKAQVYEHLAEIYAKLKDWDQAQKYQQLALPLTIKLDLKDWIYECYKLQSLIDEGKGNYQSALKNHQLYLLLKDSVYQDNYDEKMAAMSALYELETKQKAIVMLEKDQEVKEAQIKELWGLMLAGLLGLLLVIFYIRFKNQQKNNRMREIFSQDLIKAQENERQRISKELHDSVGQNILFVKNRIQRLNPSPDAALVQSVDSALEEVRNIAKGLYPNQLDQYGLGSAVEALCEIAQESSGVFMSSDLQGIDEKLNKEARINCYRIIQECINNTLKHAEASAIRISSTLHADKVELVVQDNGKGFDKSLLEHKAARSFGMINMAERIRMLRGKFEMESIINKGSKFTFSIPV